MARTKYEPRSFTTEPKAFGHAVAINWLPVGPRSEAELVASRMQNELCVRIRNAVDESEPGKLRSYAESLVDESGAMARKDYDKAVRSTYDRLAAILRGERILRLEDVARAKIHFGGALDLTNLVEFR